MGDSIVIDTVLSTKGFKQGSAALKSAIGSLSKTAKQMAGSIKSVIPSIIGVGSAFGVIQKAIGTFMSQNEQLSKKMDSVWTALGNLIGPIVERVINWVTTAVSYLLSFMKYLGLTGKTASQLSQSAKKNTTELKKTIAGFDELNVLQEQQKQDSGNPPLKNMEIPDWLKNILDMLKNGQRVELAAMLAKYLNDLVNSIDWEGYGKKFAYYFGLAINSIAKFINDFDWNNLGRKLATFFNQVLAMDEETWKNLGAILVAKFTIPFRLLTSFLEEMNASDLAKAVSNIIIGALESITDAIGDANWEKIGQNIGKFFTDLDWDGIAKAMWDAFTTAFGAASDLYEGLPGWLQDIAIGLGAIKIASEGVTIFNTLATTIGQIKNLEAVGMFGKIGEVIAIVASGAGNLNEAMTLVFGPGSVIAGIAGLIGGAIIAIKNFFDMWQNGFSWLKEILMVIGVAIAAVAAVILGAPALIAGVVAAIIAAVATAAVLIKEHWDEIKAWFKETVDNISNWWNDMCNSISEWWDDKIDKITKSIDDFANKAKQKFNDFKKSCNDVIDGIKNGFKNGINAMIGFFNGLISGAIGGINALIGAMNRLSFTVPSWVPEIGGATIGFNIPPVSARLIPYLAEGGVLKKGQVGLLEGSGAEAVVPLEKNTGWINKVAEAFVSALNGGQYAIGGNAKALAAFDSIANTVAYRTPAIAAGGVTPYSVSGGGYGLSGNESLADVIEELEKLGVKIDELVQLFETMQFVADFGDNIRALARRITKEQKRNQISEGR